MLVLRMLDAQSCNGSLCGNLSFETKLLIPSMISLSELTVGVVNVDRRMVQTVVFCL